MSVEGRLDSWAIVELMGRVRMAGRLTEEEHCGGVMGRLDVPLGPPASGGFTTTYFTASSVYRLTPCSEAAARAVAAQDRPEPVHHWELPRPVIDRDDDDLAVADRYGDDDDHDDDYPL